MSNPYPYCLKILLISTLLQVFLQFFSILKNDMLPYIF